jgi:hypothetical protein
VTNLLQEKTVHALGNAAEGRRAFVALHNVKVTSAAYEERHIRSRGRDFGIHFGTLTLTLNDERHAMRKVRVGVIGVRERIHPDDTAAVAAWVSLHRLEMLTGNFGSKFLYEWVSELAMLSHAVSWAPMSQTVYSRHGVPMAYPCLFLLYGFYKKIKVPKVIATLPANLWLGGDIWHGMIHAAEVPTWDRNDNGSAFALNLGNIKMSMPNWDYWFDNCFQTCIWFGQSAPSIGSQKRQHLKHTRWVNGT